MSKLPYYYCYRSADWVDEKNNNNNTDAYLPACTTQERIIVQATINPTRHLLPELLADTNLPDDQARKVNQAKDLLDKCLMLDPSKRATIDHCLVHPFIREKI